MHLCPIGSCASPTKLGLASTSKSPKGRAPLRWLSQLGGHSATRSADPKHPRHKRVTAGLSRSQLTTLNAPGTCCPISLNVAADPVDLRSKREALSRVIFRRPPPLPETFVHGNAVRLITTGREAFDAMLEAIRNARDRVLFEMYWFDTDMIGQQFFAVLGDAARRGVEVNLLYDAVGSFTADSSYFAELEQAGANVVEFHPLSPFQRRFRLARLTQRNHRKLLVVDGSVAFVAGLNIADAWLPHAEGGGEWRDDVIQVQGPLVWQLAQTFFSVWVDASGPPLDHRALSSEVCGDVQAAVLSQFRFRHKRQALEAYLHRLRGAEKRIFIANAYFVPNARITRALMDATQRGVDVRIMLPGRSDIELVRHASRAVWGRLLRRGARIFEYQPSILHAKTAVIDGIWSTVGSFNLDYISVRNNIELNVSVFDEGFAHVVEHSFLSDLEQCREVDPHDFAFRSLGERLAERVLYWFRAWL